MNFRFFFILFLFICQFKVETVFAQPFSQLSSEDLSSILDKIRSTDDAADLRRLNAKYQQRLKELGASNTSLTAKIKMESKKVAEKDRLLSKKEKTLSAQFDKEKQDKKEISKLKSEIKDLKKELAILVSIVTELEAKNKNLTEIVSQLEAKNRDNETLIERQSATIKLQEKELYRREKEIYGCQAIINELGSDVCFVNKRNNRLSIRKNVSKKIRKLKKDKVFVYATYYVPYLENYQPQKVEGFVYIYDDFGALILEKAISLEKNYLNSSRNFYANTELASMPILLNGQLYAFEKEQNLKMKFKKGKTYHYEIYANRELLTYSKFKI